MGGRLTLQPGESTGLTAITAQITVNTGKTSRLRANVSSNAQIFWLKAASMFL